MVYHEVVAYTPRVSANLDWVLTPPGCCRCPFQRLLLLRLCPQRYVYAPHLLFSTLLTGLMGREPEEEALRRTCCSLRVVSFVVRQSVVRGRACSTRALPSDHSTIYRLLLSGGAWGMFIMLGPSFRLAFCARGTEKTPDLGARNRCHIHARLGGTPPSNGHRRRPRRPLVGPLRPKEERMPTTK